jgi:hypothetical protein
MSRVGTRSGHKSLPCMECQKQVKAKTGSTSRMALSFRGKGQARLERHLADVHGLPFGQPPTRRYRRRVAKLAAKTPA